MQKKYTIFIVFIVLIIIAVAGIGIYSGAGTQKPNPLDGFAQCLKANGAEFYGAFWCPHCLEQKDEFGSAKQYLPYIECSNADNSQTQICKDKKIDGYPTWIFKDGTKQTGAMSLDALAQKTGCVLPK